MRVSYEVKCQIDCYLKTEISVPEIAKKLGFSKSTIYRELARNSVWNYYRPREANELAKRRFALCKRKVKIHGNLERIVQTGLKEGWSPEQVAGMVRREKLGIIGHETVYRYVSWNPEYRKYLR